VLCNSGDNVEREQHYLSVLEQQRAYGILVSPISGKDAQLRAIRRRGIPVVLVDRGSGRRQCSVSVDDVVGGELAVTHLLDCGHRDIAFVGGPVSIKQVSDRLDGARRALRAAGLPEDRISVVETGALNVSEGRSAGERIAEMPKRRRPTAAFCANDLLALGLLQEMTRRRVAVPGELAIVGYDDIEFAAAAAVPLTSIRQPRHQLGLAAAGLLIEEADHADTHQHRQVVFEPDLVVRDSTALTEAAGSAESAAREKRELA
jgi:LacI family transcriptional regulator